MASMVPKILGVEESIAKELVDFLKGRGLSGELPKAVMSMPWSPVSGLCGQNVHLLLDVIKTPQLLPPTKLGSRCPDA